VTLPARRALALVVSIGVIAGGFVFGVPELNSSVPAAQAAHVSSGATLPVGSSPAGLALSPDGKTLYVASPSTNSVLVVNTVTRKQVATISITGSLGATAVGTGPALLQLNRSGSKLYVSMENGDQGRALVVIDTASRQMLDVFSLAGVPFPFAMSPDGSLAYVPTFQCGITVLDLDAGSSTPPLFDKLGNECVITSVVADPNGRFLYAMDPNNAQVQVLDATTSPPAPLAVIGTAGRPVSGAISQDGATLSLLNAVSSTVDLMAVNSAKPAATALVASIGGGDVKQGQLLLAANRAGTVVYRLNATDNQVDVIDVVKKKVTGEFATGHNPDFFVVNASGTTGYSANTDDNTVSIIPLTGSATGSGSTGSQRTTASTPQPAASFTPIAAPATSSTPTAAALATTPTSASGLSPLVVGLIVLLVLLLAAATLLVIVLLRRSGPTPS
jgi:YVTN family beta-propeller protein